VIVVVVVVAVVFLSLRSGGSPGSSSSSARRGVELVYVAEPPAQSPHVPSAALRRTVEVIRSRAHALGLSSVSVRSVGGDQIAVKLPNKNRQQLVEALLASTVQLDFYDWEANALTPNGKTVASQLRANARTALEISQGTGVAAPGEPNTGGLRLYQAVKLAAKQRKSLSLHNARLGPQYYMFGAPGSAACAAVAGQEGTVPTAGQHCLLAGPDDEPYSTSYHAEIKNLATQLPSGVSASEGEVVVVPQGTVVLQAANPSASQQTTLSSPSAQFFVLRDNLALYGSYITNPRQSTDQSGQPDVRFGFTSAGRSAFQRVTRQVARRGKRVSSVGAHYNQHFAVAFDTQLVTVPSIDYQTYPDGVPGGSGADISGGFTTRSAKDLATELRFGPLPLQLHLVR
jgi:preprotein translocase subunit SecD